MRGFEAARFIGNIITPPAYNNCIVVLASITHSRFTFLYTLSCTCSLLRLLGRKGNYRDSFERHSSPPFFFIYFSRTNTFFTLHYIIFFFSFSWLENLLVSMAALENEDVHGFSKTVGRLALYSAQTISDIIHSVFDYLWVFGIQMRHWANCIHGVDGL